MVPRGDGRRPTAKARRHANSRQSNSRSEGLRIEGLGHPRQNFQESQICGIPFSGSKKEPSSSRPNRDLQLMIELF